EIDLGAVPKPGVHLTLPPPPRSDVLEISAEGPPKLPEALTHKEDPGFQEEWQNLEAVSQTQKMRREGTRVIDIVGKVRKQGGRFEFVPDDGAGTMTILENQLLERIESTRERQGEAAALMRWTVTGLVTEYRNSNFLLLQMVTLKQP